jgi:hypothetical protein
MKYWIRRTFTLFALIAATAIAITGVSFAAPAAPLPVPLQPLGIGLTSPILLISPSAGAEVSYNSKFAWESELQPDKYVLKFKLADGTITKYTVPMELCTLGGTCTVKVDATGVLDVVKDGEPIKWRVIATNGDEKIKSPALTFIANTVSMPELLQPLNGGQLTPPGELVWDADIANAKYILIVRDMEGALIIKRVIPYTACGEVCTYNPFTGVLEMQTQYVWFVKARGFNGDKAKSGKLSFTTTTWPVTLK